MSPATATAGPRICSTDGSVISLDVGSWSADADQVERRLLAAVEGPVLDIGCGPGRLVVALAERGVPALGVDASPTAVDQAVGRQAAALLRSVFDPLPGTGRWRTALLLDGNVGIGGDPERLLRRVAELLADDGRAVVETAPPGIGDRRFSARIEHGDERSCWFPWAQVGVDAIDALATGSGLAVHEVTADGGRWFAELRRHRAPGA